MAAKPACRVYVRKHKVKARTHAKAKHKIKARMKARAKGKVPPGASKVGPRSHKVRRIRKKHTGCGPQKAPGG
jgi:hypothetical protein